MAPTITGTARTGRRLTATVRDIADVFPDTTFLATRTPATPWIRTATDKQTTRTLPTWLMASPPSTLVADDFSGTTAGRVSITDGGQ